eukprot:182942-Hanusia_phi.AAC.2
MKASPSMAKLLSPDQPNLLDDSREAPVPWRVAGSSGGGGGGGGGYGGNAHTKRQLCVDATSRVVVVSWDRAESLQYACFILLPPRHADYHACWKLPEGASDIGDPVDPSPQLPEHVPIRGEICSQNQHLHREKRAVDQLPAREHFLGTRSLCSTVLADCESGCVTRQLAELEQPRRQR